MRGPSPDTDIGGPDVPPALLELPDPAEARRADRSAWAELLDRHLRRLARREAHCRRAIGRLAHAFLVRRGHHRLAFARLGDYTRERLGISAREFQELARVAERLDQLPAIARAFEAGELSWSHVRLLATVAGPETDGTWLERVRGCTVRALAALVGGARSDSGESAPDDDDRIDGEPRARFRIRCPRRVRRVWREAAELASRMAGSALPAWGAAEAMVAEALSGAPAAPDVAEAAGTRTPAEEIDGACRWTPLDDAAVPGDAQAAGNLAAGNLEWIDAFQLDARLRAALRALQAIDWQTGRLLRLVADHHLHRAFGHASFASYVRERAGMSARKARALVALDRGGTRVPAVLEAYRAGRISWLRALALLPIAREETATAWVARAQEVTIRRLLAEVDWAIEAGPPQGAAPPPHAAPLELPPAERQMCARAGGEPCDAEIAFVGPASVVALARAAAEASRRPGEALWQGFARLLAHAVAEWRGRPRHPDPIFERDGWRCQVPACTSRRALHDHHVVFRSQGGDNSRPNRITICAFHHLRGIHRRTILVRGTAPDEITWELGVRRGRPPLLRLRGDRYLDVGGPSAAVAAA
jgi:hypothetical protein